MMRGNFGLISLLGALLLGAPVAAADPPGKSSSSGATRRQLPPAFATRQLDLEIPFTVTAGSDPQAQAAAVQVFVSWDSGRNWHKYTEVAPDQGKFRFRAKKDAEFWFVTETVDRSGRPPRDDPKWPQLRLVVDTQKPDLKVAAAVNPANQVEMTWSVTDAHLNPETFKIEYQDARSDDAPWEPVAVPPSQMTPSRGGLAGRIAFAPLPGMRAINVRAEVADVAGNKSYFHQQLAIPLSDPRPRGPQLLTSPLAMDPGARRWPSDNRSADETNSGPASDDVESIARPPARPGADSLEIVANPHFRRDRLAASASRPPTTQERNTKPQSPGSEETLPPPAAEQKQPPAESKQPAADAAISSSKTKTLDRSEQSFPQLSAPGAASRDESSETLPPPRDAPPHRPQPNLASDNIGPIPDDGALPPPNSGDSANTASRGRDVTTTDSIPAGAQPRLTNSRRFTLDYDVESVGPEGIAEAELWATNDGGRTWLKWGTDPDRTSPMEVEVAKEATYGFRVVILGKNGLEGNKPASGDDADIWVSIDATRPTARITAAGYGIGENAGKLDIRWEASDANLGKRPVTLLYSDRPDGKYSVIAAGLENTGQYLWQFDPRSPQAVYLRLEVRDDAGNIAIDQLNDPIHIEGLIPKGRIRSLSPAPEPLPESGAFQSPLFR